jgi:hypothetical protein
VYLGSLSGKDSVVASRFFATTGAHRSTSFLASSYPTLEGKLR